MNPTIELQNAHRTIASLQKNYDEIKKKATTDHERLEARIKKLTTYIGFFRVAVKWTLGILTERNALSHNDKVTAAIIRSGLEIDTQLDTPIRVWVREKTHVKEGMGPGFADTVIHDGFEVFLTETAGATEVEITSKIPL